MSWHLITGPNWATPHTGRALRPVRAPPWEKKGGTGPHPERRKVYLLVSLETIKLTGVLLPLIRSDSLAASHQHLSLLNGVRLNLSYKMFIMALLPRCGRKETRGFEASDNSLTQPRGGNTSYRKDADHTPFSSYRILFPLNYSSQQMCSFWICGTHCTHTGTTFISFKPQSNI